MHIKIDGCDTERLVFLDHNLIFLCVPSPRALFCLYLSRRGIFFPAFFPPCFPRCHMPHLTGKTGGREARKRGLKTRGIQQDSGATIKWHELMRE